MYVTNRTGSIPVATGNIRYFNNNNLKGLGCACDNSAMNGLGELTDDESGKIVEEHFKNLPTATLISISTGVATGNYTPVKAEVKAIAEKICTAGAKSRVIDTLTSPYGLVGLGLVGVLTISAIFGRN